MTLVTLTRKPVGKGQVLDSEGKNQAIEYQGFAEDIIPELDSLIEAVGGEDELFRTIVRDAINDYLFKQVADPIAKYIVSTWDEEVTKNFRTCVRSMGKLIGIDKAAKLVLAQMA